MRYFFVLKTNYFLGGAGGLDVFGGLGKDPGTMPFFPPFEGLCGFEFEF